MIISKASDTLNFLAGRETFERPLLHSSPPLCVRVINARGGGVADQFRPPAPDTGKQTFNWYRESSVFARATPVSNLIKNICRKRPEARKMCRTSRASQFTVPHSARTARTHHTHTCIKSLDFALLLQRAAV
jgi:hypothetical protein